MRLLALLLLLLAPELALSQGVSVRLAPAVGRAQLVNRGRLVPEDVNTVSHVYWNGAALVDSKGVAWTQTGTVPMVKATRSRPAGGGAFSDANYYATTLVADVFDFVGDYTCTLVMQPTTTGGNQMPFGTDAAGTSGFGIQLASGTYWEGDSLPAWTTTQALTGASWSGLINVVSWGRSSGNVYIKSGITAAAGPVARAAPVTASAVASQLGRYPGGAQPWTGAIYELHCTTTAWNPGAVAALHQRINNLR